MQDKAKHLMERGMLGKSEIRKTGEVFQKLLYAGKIQEAQTILNKFFKAIKSPFWEVRKEVADNIPEVLKTLEHTSKEKKLFHQACQFLCGMLEQEKENEVLLALANSLSSVANQLLAGGDFVEGIELVKLLGNCPRIQNDALFEREKRAILQTDSILKVLHFLSEKKSEEREIIFRSMKELGTLVMEPLLEALALEKGIQVRARLVKTIASIGEKAFDYLVPMLADSRWFVVRNIVSILGDIGTERAVEPLMKISHHHDARVRKEVLIALSKIGVPQTNQVVLNAFDDGNNGVLGTAADLAAKLGIKEALSPLLKMVRKMEKYQNIDSELRSKAILAFGRLAPEKAFNELTGILEKKGGLLTAGEAPEIRASAALALGFSDNRKAQEILQELVKKDSKPEVKNAARKAITMIKSRMVRQAGEKPVTWEHKFYD